MKKYWLMFTLGFETFMEYRADMVVYTISNSLTPFIGLALWLTVYQSGSHFAYSQPEMILYFIAAAVVGIITVTWGSYNVEQGISTGGFAQYQIKPYSLLGEYLAHNTSEKMYQLSIITVILVIVGLGFLRSLPVSQVITWQSLGLAMVSVSMSFLITVLLDLMVGLMFIWFHDVDFVRSFLDLSKNFFSGKIIPIVFLPLWAAQIAFWLPFRYMVSFPIEVLLQKVQGPTLWWGFGLQVAWVVTVSLLYRLIYRQGLKSYQGYGA